MRQRGAATGGQGVQRLFGLFHLTGGRQHQLGLTATEGDDGNLVAALVGVLQQAEHRALYLLHALLRGHGAGGIHHQHNQIALFCRTHLVVQVGAGDGKFRRIALDGMAQGGVQCQCLRLGVGHGAHAVATPAFSTVLRRPLASLSLLWLARRMVPMSCGARAANTARRHCRL
jgi:hypothetical protein